MKKFTLTLLMLINTLLISAMGMLQAPPPPPPDPNSGALGGADIPIDMINPFIIIAAVLATSYIIFKKRFKTA